MLFTDSLRDMVNATEGAIAGLMMDSAGVALASYVSSEAVASPGEPAVDIDAVGVEFGVLLSAIRRAVASLEAGETREVTIGTDKMVTIIRPLGNSYFVAMSLRPDGNIGKGRFLMRTADPQLRLELQ